MADDIRVFKQTSDEPYDRHHYALVLKNGKKIIVEDYETVRNLWWNMCAMGNCSHIDVLDLPKKKGGGKGF